MDENTLRKKGIPYLPQEEYDKAIGQLRLQVGGVLSVFHQYGMDIYVAGAITEIIKLAEDFGLRVRGMDKPISLERIRKRH